MNAYRVKYLRGKLPLSREFSPGGDTTFYLESWTVSMYAAEFSCPNITTINSSVIRNFSIQPEPKQLRYNIKSVQHAKLTAVAKVASVYLLDKTVAILKRAHHALAVFTQTELQISFATNSIKRYYHKCKGKKWKMKAKIPSCNEAEMQSKLTSEKPWTQPDSRLISYSILSFCLQIKLLMKRNAAQGCTE